jgi:hypothetical protein
MSLTCPSCGNEKNFQVKTLQLHLLQVEETGIDVSDEGRPALLELLCDECEAAMDFLALEGELRQEILQKLD